MQRGGVTLLCTDCAKLLRPHISTAGVCASDERPPHTASALPASLLWCTLARPWHRVPGTASVVAGSQCRGTHGISKQASLAAEWSGERGATTILVPRLSLDLSGHAASSGASMQFVHGRVGHEAWPVAYGRHHSQSVALPGSSLRGPLAFTLSTAWTSRLWTMSSKFAMQRTSAPMALCRTSKTETRYDPAPHPLPKAVFPTT